MNQLIAELIKKYVEYGKDYFVIGDLYDAKYIIELSRNDYIAYYISWTYNMDMEVRVRVLDKFITEIFEESLSGNQK